MERKIVSIVCILSVLFSMMGCSSKKETNENDTNDEKMGRYVEQEAEVPELGEYEQSIGVLLNKSGQLEYYTYKQMVAKKCNVYCYQLIDNKYESSSVTWATDAAKSCGCTPVQIILGQDDNYYMLGQTTTTKQVKEDVVSYESGYHLFQQDLQNGTFIDITPESWKSDGHEEDEGTFKGHFINQIEISENRILCYQIDNQMDICFYDLNKGKEINKTSLQTDQSYTIKGNVLYYMPTGGASVNSYNITSGEEEKTQVSTVKVPASLQISEAGDIYMINSLGIHCYKNGGTMWETLVDGTICSMSIPTYEMISFVLVPGESDMFYVMYRSLSGDGSTLFTKYCYDPTIASNFKKELTVYSLWENKSIRQSIFDYMKKHMDTKVTYIVANTDNSSALISDQIRELNTEILSGKGADIIVLDGLPVQSYIEKGVLSDIGDLFSTQLHNGGLVENIANNYMKDGKVYGMPVRFYIPMFAFSEDIGDKDESLSTLAQLSANPDKQLLEALPYRVLLTMFLYTYSNEFIGSDGMVDMSALNDFLTNIKTIADHTDAIPEDDANYGLSLGYSENERISTILCGNAAQLLVNDTYASMGYTSDMSDIQVYESCTNEVKGNYKPVNHSFIPNGVVGINNSTKDIDLAKDFVKSLYTEEEQKNHLNDGFPINTQALNEWMEEEPDGNHVFRLIIGDKNGVLHKVETNLMSVSEKKKIYEMMLTLTQPVYNDTVTEDIIIEGGLAYLRNERSLSEAADDIANKISLYQNEQR